jgi:hypothetical protein
MYLLRNISLPFFFQVTEKSKDDRRKIHEAIKDGFGKEVYSNTVDRGTKKFITIFKTRKGGKHC